MALTTSVISLAEKEAGQLLDITLTGRLEKEDYELFVPEIEKLMERHGTVRILVELRDFQGWSAGALWEDTKFGFRHFNDIDRIAIVGDRAWEKGMALFCKAFTRAEVRYFDVAEMPEARAWIMEGLAGDMPGVVQP